MNQQASKNIAPSAGEDVSGVETLLSRNLPEVFGEDDPARRRAAIRQLYTEDCVLCVPSGTYAGHEALNKFAGDLRATHPHYVYTPHGKSASGTRTASGAPSCASTPTSSRAKASDCRFEVASRRQSCEKKPAVRRQRILRAAQRET
jgi:hypothetical protein